jgi:hypothetical protein
VAASLLRALSGFLISVVLVVPLGVVVGWHGRLGDLLNQFIENLPQYGAARAVAGVHSSIGNRGDIENHHGDLQDV